MMRIIPILLAVAVLFGVLTIIYDNQVVMEDGPLLVEDSAGEGALPKRFRTMQEAISTPEINTKGLEKLRASGSGVFNAEQLQGLKQAVKAPAITLVDLRQESHGFVNGMGISWYGTANAANQGKSLASINEDEKAKLMKIRMMGKADIATIQDKSGGVITKYTIASVDVDEVIPEYVLAQSLGLNYTRFPVQDHTAPRDNDVDGYITLIRDLPEDAWLHAHCRGGKGRTTTFLTVYDMMMNAKDVRLEDIIARQHALGGSDLFKTSTDAYKQKAAEARKAFITKFYDYAKENNDGFKTLWSEWLKQHG